MSRDITVQQRTQRINITPTSGVVVLENEGPIGPPHPSITVGTGSPEGSVVATPGTIYLNQSGGTGTTLYVKETGTGNTGWAAK